MATNLSQEVADLARRVALDQIEQDIKNNETFAKREDVEEASQTTARLLALEASVSELIRKVWAQEKVEPLSLAVASDSGEDAFSAVMRGSRAAIEVVQDETTGNVKSLYVRSAEGIDPAQTEAALQHTNRKGDRNYDGKENTYMPFGFLYAGGSCRMRTEGGR